jgi:hypothetical protein
MTAIETAISDALANGWDDTNTAFGSDKPETSMASVNGWEYDEKVFLDPSFWQALGKARDWLDWIAEDHVYTTGQKGSGRFTCPICAWHCFIDHIAKGKDAESFFATL